MSEEPIDLTEFLSKPEVQEELQKQFNKSYSEFLGGLPDTLLVVGEIHLPKLATGVVIVRAYQTCLCDPAQWNAWDAEGQYYYLRYRCGRGSIEKAASEEDYLDGNGILLGFFDNKNRHDSEIELEDLARQLGFELRLEK